MSFRCGGSGRAWKYALTSCPAKDNLILCHDSTLVRGSALCYQPPDELRQWEDGLRRPIILLCLP
jgi:hypothetical protein